ncbi:hypothetical protein T459_09012 [Capsicum annuum]|uniref:Ubiquitin-like protease family profile domain-containing protein n=1 Tax=Capsicum annuum TaxID=4072 RepID=A0A2G2ZY66_CAPAN|nr:hypothetical protein FXO37_15982 [Capsicum annuum]PHT86906.1 hypothetical protein T459_09012 [Capsicum annuum]
MLDLMKYQVYKRKSMYRCGGLPLAFPYWFYECCPYGNDKLVVRVGDNVPWVLNWSVTPVPQKEHDVFKKSDGSSDSSKEHMREDSPVNSQNELKLLRTDLNLLKDEVLSMKQLMTSSFDLIFKALHINEGNHIEVNLSDNVGWQTDEVGNKLSANLVDDIEKENVDVGDHIDVVAGDHLSDNVVDDIEEEIIGVGDRIDTDAGDTYYSEISKYTQPDKIGEHSVIEKTVGKIDTDLGYTSVALVATEVLIDVGSVRKNVDDTSVGDKSTVILDDTPVVPSRIRKPAAICESPYVSKFDSGCSNVQGQSTRCIDKGPSRKHIFSIKHPFTISITEPFLDMKLLSLFNKFVDKSLRLNSNPVYSESAKNLTNAFDFGVVAIKTKEWFYMLGYAGVPLTDSTVTEKTISAYSELIPNLLFSIDFWDKRSDGIAAADSFDIRMVDGLPTQKNTDCGIFVIAFAKYIIEGAQIPAILDDIDSIQSRYGALLWQYGKTKQKQRAINDDESTERLKKKKKCSKATIV